MGKGGGTEDSPAKITEHVYIQPCEEPSILEKKVEALNDLVFVKDLIIGELEAYNARLKERIKELEANQAYTAPRPYNVPPSIWTNIPPPMFNPPYTCKDGSPCTYPNAWTGTGCHCTKCGTTMSPFITSTGLTGSLPTSGAV